VQLHFLDVARSVINEAKSAAPKSMKRNTQLAKLIIAKRNAPNAIAALATANKKQNVKKNGRGF